MRVLIQRVKQARVTVNEVEIARIGPGLMVFLGVGYEDGESQVSYLAEKIANLRMFDDVSGKVNLSLLETGGEALVVSQFTLYADTRKGRRPSFVRAAPPEHAEPLVEAFAVRLRGFGITTKTGRFGAHMLVEIANDGPLTIWLERE